MTLTRKYYENLITLCGEICSVKNSEVILFIDKKNELINLIERIIKFNLFPLSFTDSFFQILHKNTIENFTDEKLNIVNELHFELNECLYTSRLRYGGELLHYIFEIKLSLLKLSIIELGIFEIIKKEPIHYFFPEKFIFKTESDKKERIRQVKQSQKQGKNTLEKVTIKKLDYEKIEAKLQKYFSDYSSYIIENYTSLANSFSYYNKDVRAYITQAISNDIFEFRLHSYKTDGNSSISLKNEYYDFYPAYFYNLEEIASEQVDALAFILQRKTYDFSNPFSIKNIHLELLNLFIKNADEKNMKEFIAFLLKLDGYKLEDNLQSINDNFDLFGTKSNKSYHFEIYHHKPRSVDILLNRISKLPVRTEFENSSFIFTTFPGEYIYDVLKVNNINAFYISDLISKHFEVDNSIILSWFIKNSLDTLKPNEENIFFKGKNLIERLKNCPTGLKNWSEYEAIGSDIFRFLFEDNFKSYLAVEQFENDLKNHRRDLIVSNFCKDQTSFWADAKQAYKSKAIIVDFKNYSEKLNSTTLFSVSKYISKNVGNLAIVFSRKGIDDTAVKQQKTMLADGKLIIEFNDNELIEMINEKSFGKDPSDRLKSKEFSLIKSY